MPAQSKAQQRFMGMVHAAQKGELDNPSPEVAKVAKDMSDKDAKDFASTSHKGLPNRVKKEILNRLKQEYGLMLPGHNIKPAAPAQSLEDLEGVNESWTVKDGSVLSNGKLIGYYDFDRDSDSFWVDDVKKGKGQLSFDTKKEVEDYFKKNEKDAVKHLQKLRESVNPEEINSSVIPAALKVRFERALELTQGKELTYNQKLKLLAMVIDSLGIDKSELSKISSKLKTNLD